MKMNEQLSYKCLTLILITTLTGCASLPNSTIERVNARKVEFALTQHNTIPVVFESGLGGRMEWWKKVVPALSNDTTTFVYNRPGYGQSELVLTPRDGTHVVDELRTLLKSKGLPSPYVLVGHSLGGLYMQLFARRYPQEVSALILVDSTHPEQFKGKGSPENWPFWLRLTFNLVTSPVEKQELSAVDKTGSEVLDLPTLTDKPVIVLSAAQPLKEKSEIADDTNEKRRGLASLYPGCKQIWVDSGHAIPLENPESIIAAIREVIPTTSSSLKHGALAD